MSFPESARTYCSQYGADNELTTKNVVTTPVRRRNKTDNRISTLEGKYTSNNGKQTANSLELSSSHETGTENITRVAQRNFNRTQKNNRKSGDIY